MSWMPFLTSYILLMHNIVDFRENGACETYAQRLNCIVTEYVEMLEKCNDLHLVNKTGFFGDKICKIGLQFESGYAFNLNNARKFMIELIDSFVNIMNQDPRLHQYLDCPFTSDNIELRIHFVDNCFYHYPAPNRIAYITFMDGQLTFDIGNPRLPGALEKLREEPLVLSRQILTRLSQPYVRLPDFYRPPSIIPASHLPIPLARSLSNP